MDYDKISELAEKERVEEANSLLKKGWVFVKAAETLKLDQNGQQFTVITYILGKLRQAKISRQPKSDDLKSAPKPTIQIPDILSLNIDWRQKNGGNPNFYYAFVNSLDGNPDPVVAPVVEVIKKNDGVIIQNGWRFAVKNHFLMRSKVSVQQE
jgi:hypothetical protein